MTDFSATRARFHLPEGVVYLDGNSLGPLPVHAPVALERTSRAEWGALLIRGMFCVHHRHFAVGHTSAPGCSAAC